MIFLTGNSSSSISKALSNFNIIGGELTIPVVNISNAIVSLNANITAITLTQTTQAHPVDFYIFFKYSGAQRTINWGTINFNDFDSPPSPDVGQTLAVRIRIYSSVPNPIGTWKLYSDTEVT